MRTATAAATMGTGRDVTASVWTALGTVRDPELDRPITDLKFVSEVSAEDGQVRVRLRLPTYFCAPNFAYLMVDDARRAIAGLPGVTGVEVVLEDHFASGEINDGVAAGEGFEAAFDGLAAGELGGLRRVFLRKGYLAAQERVCAGLADPDVRLGDVPDSPAKEAFLLRRAELGLDCAPDAYVLADPDGEHVPAERATRYLRFARTVRISMESNEEYCRGLLRIRYEEKP
jgi:metal-sulfur cluster biosynthetic enzyme